jgi:radical SAM enzyme (TIGR01210 family)
MLELDFLHKIDSYIPSGSQIKCSLLFGSFASNTQTAISDVDIIYIVKNKHKKINYYERINIESTIVDLNIYDIETFEKKIGFFEWQYRIQNIKILKYDNQTNFNAIKNLPNLIHTEPARIYRIKEIQKYLLKFKDLIDFFPYNTLGHNLILYQSLVYLVHYYLETNKILPFSIQHKQFTKYPIDIYCEWRKLCKNLASLRSYIRNKLNQEENYMDIEEQDYFKLPLSLLSEVYDVNNMFNLTLDVKSIKKLIITSIEKIKQINNESFKLENILRKDKHITKNGSSRLIEFDKRTERLKIIIPTGGCKVSSCIFCDLSNIATFDEEFNIESILNTFKRIKKIALYTDGSFFDDKEINAEKLREIILAVNKHYPSSLLIESLPQFIDYDKLKFLYSILDNNIKLEIAVGIQTINAEIRGKILSTPISSECLSEFFKLKEIFNYNVRIYLLYGKPLMSINEEISDILRSLDYFDDILSESDRITINPMHTSSSTVIGKLYSKHYYKEFPIGNLLREIRNIKKHHKYEIEFGKVENPTSVKEKSFSYKANEYILNEFSLFNDIDTRLCVLKELINI